MRTQTNPTTWWLRMFFAGFAVVFVLMLWTWLTPVFHGDLARMARVSEHHYAGAIRQPAIDEARLTSTRFADADVLVLGDSFSAPLYWQSVLVGAGLRVKTIEWRHIPGLCADFGEWARHQGYKGSIIVVQNVERELAAQLKKNAACSMEGYLLKDAPRHTAPPPVEPAGFALNWSETLSTGVVTAWQTWRAMRARTELKFKDVLLRPLPEGCRLFSHRTCDRVLLLARDVTTPTLTAAELAQMEAQRRALQPLRLRWIVLPNKTSVYFERHDPFWRALPEQGLGPDLHRTFIDDKWRIRDLYAPDNTHLSPAGYLRLGELVLQSLPAR